MRARILRSLPIAPALLLAAAVGVPQTPGPPAPPKQYCVGATGTACTGGTFSFDAAGLSAAIAASQATAATDEIRIAPGTISGAAGIVGDNLSISGSPRAQGETVVQFAAGTPSAVVVGGDGNLADLTLTGALDTGVRLGSPAGTHAIDRLQLKGFKAALSVTDASGTVEVRDTLIDLGTRADAVGVSASSIYFNFPPNIFLSTAADVRLTRVTIVGSGSGQIGAAAGASGNAANVSARSSVIDLSSSSARTLKCTVSFGTATASTTNSAARANNEGCGAMPAPAINLALSIPWFVNPSEGDYRLQNFSPMVDAAADAVSPGTTDALGLPRGGDGDGDGTAKADIGAFEYQRRPPGPPTIELPPAITVAPGEAIQFKATATDPDGEFPFITWDFGDGSAPGSGSIHAYAALGTYTAKATATDPVGLTSTPATVQVTVANPPAPAGTGGASPTPPPLDPFATATGPRVRVLAAPTAPIVRGGAGFSTVPPGAPDVATIEVAGASTVRVSLTRLAPGRRAKAKSPCTPGARRGKRCTARVPVSAIAQIPVTPGQVGLRFGGKLGGRRLAKGSYEVSVTPVGLDKRRGTPATYPLTLR